MSHGRPSVAGPVLFWGIASGMVASLVCCFWPGVVGGAFFGVRGVRRDHDLTPGTAALLGVATGSVAGALVATFGTAMLLASAGPEQMQAMQELGLEAELPGLGALAFGHATLGFCTAVLFGLIGGAVAGGGPTDQGTKYPKDSPGPVTASSRLQPPPTEGAVPDASAAPPPPSAADISSTGHAPHEPDSVETEEMFAGLEDESGSDAAAWDAAEPPEPPLEGGSDDEELDETT